MNDESAEKRPSAPVELGNVQGKLTTVGRLYRRGHFKNEDEAHGAFKLALQQYLDGLGPTLADWLGISPADAIAYKHGQTLPRRRR